MANAWLPGDTWQCIQDLIKGNNTTQADLVEIIGLMILKNWGYRQKRQNLFTSENWIPVCQICCWRILVSRSFWSSLLARYQDKTIKSGIAVMNQQLILTNSLPLKQAECVPNNADAATQLASDLSDICMSIINADTSAIQNPFMLIVKDVKLQGEAIAAGSNVVIAEVLQCLREGLSKGQDSSDLRRITAEGLTTAVIRAISTADISEDTSHCIDYAYKKVLDEVREAIHDE